MAQDADNGTGSRPAAGQVASENGASALVAASQKGHLATAEQLLDAGAKPNAIGANGTALDLAIEEDYEGVVKLLRKWGAKTKAELVAEE